MSAKFNQLLTSWTTMISNQKQLNALKLAIVTCIPIVTCIDFLLLLSGFQKEFFHYAQVVSIYSLFLRLLPLILAYFTAFYLVGEEDNLNPQGVGICAFFLCAMFNFRQGALELTLETYAWQYANAGILSMLCATLMKESKKLSLQRFFPKNTPSAVWQSLDNLVPVSCVLGVGLVLLLGVPASWELLVSKLFLGITHFVASYLGVCLVIVLTCSFWILGIHGVGVIGTILRPFWLFMVLWNVYLYGMNSAPIYIGSEVFLTWFVWIGGSGCTIGSLIYMRYLAESSHLKEVGKQSTLAGIFNINESIIFGLPIAENKLMRIPFITTPLVCASLTYVLMKHGLLSIPLYQVAWVIPSGVGAWMASGGEGRVFLYSILLVFVSFILYLPFLIFYDKQLYKEEMSCVK